MKLKKPNQSGTAIVLVISIMATLMVIVGVAAEYTTTIQRNVGRSNTLGGAIAIADGVIEHNFAHWRKICQMPGSSTPTTGDLRDDIPLPTQAQFPGIKNFTATQSDYDDQSNATVQQCRVVALDPQYQQMLAPTKQIGQGASSIIYNWRATAYVTLPALRGKVVAKVERIFQKEQLSPWNWAIFYNDPLEIHPGPEFHVTGWVHTNSDLYTGHESLWFEEKVTYGGNWSEGFMPGDGQHPESPTSPHYPADLPPAPDANGHKPFDVAAFDPTDSNPNNDSYRELIEPPVAGQPDPLAGDPGKPPSRYYDQAGVIIEIDGGNNVTLKKPDGTVINDKSKKQKDKDLYDMFKDAVTPNQTIQDNREQAQVRLATLDLKKIGDDDEYKYENFNGIIYIHDTSATSSARRGIRLVNGEEIPPKGLTVASNNPVYIQGDFNTGGKEQSIPSNKNGAYNDPANPPEPTKSDYTRRPASIVADAVNILSNSWKDANSFAGTGSRAASNTTINAAIVSGIVPSGSSGNNYSGGAENFPRFLENWSNQTLTYYGSMVQLYKSQQSTGTWGKGNVYSPPLRRWYFDPNFRTDPPPGSLMVYKYKKGRWALAP